MDFKNYLKKIIMTQFNKNMNATPMSSNKEYELHQVHPRLRRDWYLNMGTHVECSQPVSQPDWLSLDWNKLQDMVVTFSHLQPHMHSTPASDEFHIQGRQRRQRPVMFDCWTTLDELSVGCSRSSMDQTFMQSLGAIILMLATHNQLERGYVDAWPVGKMNGSDLKCSWGRSVSWEKLKTRK